MKGRMALPDLISGIQTRKLLSKGTQGYLAYLINTPKYKVIFEYVAIVKDQSDIFPQELMLLPPERKIEFKI